jgi:diguanylate cyclase (GGDEF)-like protein/PAS domain S-box-containing protein
MDTKIPISIDSNVQLEIWQKGSHGGGMNLATEAQEILFDMAVLGLFVFLFLAMSHGRKDARLRLWTAGWLFVIAHFAIEVWAPAGIVAQNVQSCISIDALLLAASCFIYSHAMLRLPAHTPRAAAASLIPLTLLAVNLAICGGTPAALLALLVIGRQALAIAWFRKTRHQLQFARSSILMALLLGAWMLFSVLRRHPDIIVYGLLCEVYLSTALNFYAFDWRHSVAVKTMIAGFAAWGAVFPIGYLTSVLWPHLAIDREIWNLPKFFVAVGMILVVMEEDAVAARALGEDYRALFDSNPEPLWITDGESLRVVAGNEAALNLHGYTREEFLQLDLTDLLPPDVWEMTRRNIRSGGETRHRRIRHLRKDGASVFLDLRVRDAAFQGARCRFAMGIDVTEREKLLQQLDYQAGHDRLTGLPNRMLLPDLLAKALQHAADSEEQLAVLSIDLDRFKRINDVYGLRIGDAYIEFLAGILASRMRSMDIVARTGGDEFVIVVTGLKSRRTAEQEVQDLMRLFEQPLFLHGYKIQTSVSIGVAVAPDDGVDPLALWRGAERARIEAQTAGGNQVVWLSAELKRTADEQVRLEDYLRTHIGDGGLHLVYQPIYAADGSVKGMEALLRLDHPELGPVSPGKLIPIAESSGLIIPLGEWVIDEVCRQLLLWKSEGVPVVPVSLNISGLHMMQENFARQTMATLNRYLIDPRLIHVEVTESVAMRNVDAVTEQMAALAAEGIEFSIDDFGTGHSSLARLSQLGASFLKIDRSFLAPDCGSNVHSIVQAIISMAHTLGHKVVAEGVENQMQLACLRDLQCDFYQGYLLSRPVPPHQIPALLRSPHPAFGSSVSEEDTLHLVERARA